jgi:hypothetical protein
MDQLQYGLKRLDSISILSVAVLICLLYLLYNREATPLRRVPGPFLASISKIWIVLQQRGLQRPIVDLALHRKYGSIVRIAPKEVIVSSPQSKKTIYGELKAELRRFRIRTLISLVLRGFE